MVSVDVKHYVYLLTYLLTDWLTDWLTYLLTYLLACLLACLLTYLLACLLTYLLLVPYIQAVRVIRFEFMSPEPFPLFSGLWWQAFDFPYGHYNAWPLKCFCWFDVWPVVIKSVLQGISGLPHVLHSTLLITVNKVYNVARRAVSK